MIRKIINKLFHVHKHEPLSQYWLDAWNKNERANRQKVSEEFKSIEEKMLNCKRKKGKYNPSDQ